MKIPRPPHAWSVSPTRAVRIQRELATRIVRRGRPVSPTLFAGVDLAFTRDGDQCIAGVVVWDPRSDSIVEQRVLRRSVRFPYVPGLLSFREAPAIIAVLRRLRSTPDVFLFDGHGFAHPRRFGLACHVGLLIDRPSVGCAKSLLVGSYDMPPTSAGSMTLLTHHGQPIGRVVRTRDLVKPIFVSVGHRISLDVACRVTMAACRGFRLPEPTRLADKLVARARADG